MYNELEVSKWVKFKIGNQKYPYWKLISKLVFGNIEIGMMDMALQCASILLHNTVAVVEFHLISDVGISFSL